jgi:tRNA modification GTPase
MADQQADRSPEGLTTNPASGRTDTIVASATAPGPAAVAIVRLAGPRAAEIARRITHSEFRPRHAALRTFHDQHGVRIDQGLVLYFPAPHSYTGEDIVELHGHGGAVVTDWLLESAIAFGARAAQAGEFTLRAFLNGKLDLAEAEAVADLVASGSRAAASAALRSLTGAFSAQVEQIQEELTALRVQVEAWLDFPDEEIERDALLALAGRATALLERHAALRAAAGQGAVLRDGLTIVIAGAPNAGKSSLLNRLAGHDAAIVTQIPGTTRDTLREYLSIDGLPVTVIDTAGLREAQDPVEQEGVRRTRSALGRADLVLWVADLSAGLEPALRAARAAVRDAAPIALIANKIDLLGIPAGTGRISGVPVIHLSALTGEGIEGLRAHLRDAAGFVADAPGTFTARRRHLDALDRSAAHIGRARDELAATLELAAEELRAAQGALSELTGQLDSDDLLGEIFASFCIGK